MIILKRQRKLPFYDGRKSPKSGRASKKGEEQGMQKYRD